MINVIIFTQFQVNYMNHASYQSGPKGRKHGSPVRFFTNVDLSKIKLPAEEGYRYKVFITFPLLKNSNVFISHTVNYLLL